MLIQIIITIVLGYFLFKLGMRFGRVMLRSGATANDIFKGKSALSLAFLGIYFCLLLLALNVPQMQILPLEWRFYGMQATWTLLRLILLGICGMAFAISWHTSRQQVVAVFLIGLLGLIGFTGAEAYFLAPIYPSLQDNLQPNGVFKQTSSSSCASAALATILRRWGVNAMESSVAKVAGTSRLGTSMPQLIVGAKAFGMDGLELSPTWEQMQQINRPGVLGVWLFDGIRKLPHAVALLKLNDNFATIGDPARGRIFEIDRAVFAKVWRQQYVPIFRPQDIKLNPDRAADYLQKLGYLKKEGDLQVAIGNFQQAQGLKVTGKLNPETILLLSGSFLQGIPTLST